jgi:hypothetical protein
MSNSVLVVSLKWEPSSATYGRAVFQNGLMIEATMIPSRFNMITNLAQNLSKSLHIRLVEHVHYFKSTIDWNVVKSEINQLKLD